MEEEEEDKLGLEGGYCPKAAAHGQNVCVTLSKQEWNNTGLEKWARNEKRPRLQEEEATQTLGEHASRCRWKQKITPMLLDLRPAVPV